MILMIMAVKPKVANNRPRMAIQTGPVSSTGVITIHRVIVLRHVRSKKKQLAALIVGMSIALTR